METETRKPSFSLKNHPFIATLIIDMVLVLLVLSLRPKLTHDFYNVLLKMIPFSVCLSFLIPLEKVVSLPKNKDTKLKKAFKVIQSSLMITMFFINAFTPFEDLLLNSPPDKMDLDTARRIITENQPLLKVVLDEMRLPTAEEAQELASMEVTTSEGKVVSAYHDAPKSEPMQSLFDSALKMLIEAKQQIMEGTYHSRKLVAAHPDALKSETIQSLFDLGNFVSIVRDGDMITFYGGNYDKERFGSGYDQYGYYNTSTYFYYKPDDKPDLSQILRFSYQLEESSDNKWVYKGNFTSGIDGRPVISTYTIHRILPNWFYVFDD